MESADQEQTDQYIIQITGRSPDGGRSDDVVGYVIAEQVRYIAAEEDHLAPESRLVLGSLREMFARGEKLTLKALPLPSESKPEKGKIKIVARIEGTSAAGTSADN